MNRHLALLQYLPLMLACCTLLFAGNAAAKEDFATWLENIRFEAKALGMADDTTLGFVSRTAYLPNVIKLDRAQPEFISPFLDYFAQRVDNKKVQKGRALLLKHQALLTEIEAQYGVPRQILIAFWGMETQYGRVQGNLDVLSALATLAYEGRRADFFKAQLLDALLMVDLGYVDAESFKGSWAGAFGNMQFMPTTFMLYAVDGDADGAIDVINSLPDAFASAAHYLAEIGWQIRTPVMLEVKLPAAFDLQSAQLAVKKTPQTWAKLGVQAYPLVDDELEANATAIVDGDLNAKPNAPQQPEADAMNSAKDKQSSDVLMNDTAQTSILLPQGWQGPAFMVFDNFDIIMQWNRSVNYALSVAQLAKLLNQEPSIMGGGFAEGGALTYQQMLDLQNRLNARGFDAGAADGLPGLQTQAAIRAYQAQKQMPVDGYASPSLYQSVLLH
ncbi:lytic murein transglycosylase [Methylotenera mobilis]|uniref:Lytic murein transglycosylase n=1 Tax=Methylotenera mobilis (strain JLW8 / ATCC BAA-1282 / DSM 17540) TaxID=583345 RepID=C6WX44_METML|nr:lytic murein transglycosylase [Methylotenera mobilis]ACT48493.1 lytic murein transglycosylase [Methylotenera mobilis JLW8]